MNHYVYEITNCVNGKKYIGKRSTNVDIDKDTYFGSGVLIKKAIKKYGISNFTKRIIKVCQTEEEAYSTEFEEIAKVKAYNNPNYYNIALGGKGGLKGLKFYYAARTKPRSIDKYLENEEAIRKTVVLNPEEYLYSIEKDFSNADGNTYYKLLYYCFYLKSKLKCVGDIQIILMYISREYMLSKKYSEKDWIYVINAIIGFCENKCDNIYEIDSKRLIKIYNAELKQIFDVINFSSYKNVYKKHLKKVALSLLIIYKMKSDCSSYISYQAKAVSDIVGITFANYKIDDDFQALEKLGIIQVYNNKFKFLTINEIGDLYITLSSLTRDNDYIIDLFEDGIDISRYRCRKCGGIIHQNKAGTKKYCKFCAGYKAKGMMMIKCIDCGKEVIIQSMNSRAVRCHDCQNIKNKQLKADRNKRYYNKSKNKLIYIDG